jgi:hypothetical protein
LRDGIGPSGGSCGGRPTGGQGADWRSHAELSSRKGAPQRPADTETLVRSGGQGRGSRGKDALEEAM